MRPVLIDLAYPFSQLHTKASANRRMAVSIGKKKELDGCRPALLSLNDFNADVGAVREGNYLLYEKRGNMQAVIIRLALFVETVFVSERFEKC